MYFWQWLELITGWYEKWTVLLEFHSLKYHDAFEPFLESNELHLLTQNCRNLSLVPFYQLIGLRFRTSQITESHKSSDNCSGEKINKSFTRNLSVGTRRIPPVLGNHQSILTHAVHLDQFIVNVKALNFVTHFFSHSEKI